MKDEIPLVMEKLKACSPEYRQQFYNRVIELEKSAWAAGEDRLAEFYNEISHQFLDWFEHVDIEQIEEYLWVDEVDDEP